jgi:uncharacterized protein with PIN domain
MTVCQSTKHDPVESAPRTAEFRFYAELNDLLAAERRGRSFVESLPETSTIGDVVTAIGVPPAEIDLVLVDGKSVGLDHTLIGGERVAVFPVFERFDVSPVIRLRDRPLRRIHFVADVHLGALARYLRMIGFDTVYSPDLLDGQIIMIALEENRIILSRDQELLKNRAVTHGYLVRHTRPQHQIQEIVEALHLADQMEPFSRCIRCNGALKPVAAGAIADHVPPNVLASFQEYTRCEHCSRVYWKGSHYERMSRFIQQLTTVRLVAVENEGQDRQTT